MELELKTFMMKHEQEVLAHKETVARFNADKKHILMSTEEANLEAIRGRHLAHKKIYDRTCEILTEMHL